MDSVQGSERALYDVFKTERAVAGEPLAFAATTQVLPVRPFRVHVACRPWTRTACLLTALGEKIKMNRQSLMDLKKNEKKRSQ